MISMHRLKPHIDGLVSIEMRDEASDEVIFSATTDHDLTDGFFFIYDAKGSLVGSIRPESIFGLSFMLYSHNDSDKLSQRGSVLYEGGGAGYVLSGRKEARIKYRQKWEDIFASPTPIDFDVTMGSRAIEEADRRNALLPSLNFSTNISSCLPVQDLNCVTAYTDEEEDDDHMYHYNQYHSLGGDMGPQSVETLLTDCETLKTRSPVWNTEVGAYLSNFGSRVKRHERSNFILIANNSSFVDQEAATVMVRFGRVLRNQYVCDFRKGYYLTPMVAFSCALASMVRKPLLGDF